MILLTEQLNALDIVPGRETWVQAKLKAVSWDLCKKACTQLAGHRKLPGCLSLPWLTMKVFFPDRQGEGGRILKQFLRHARVREALQILYRDKASLPPVLLGSWTWQFNWELSRTFRNTGSKIRKGGMNFWPLSPLQRHPVLLLLLYYLAQKCLGFAKLQPLLRVSWNGWTQGQPCLCHLQTLPITGTECLLPLAAWWAPSQPPAASADCSFPAGLPCCLDPCMSVPSIRTPRMRMKTQGLCLQLHLFQLHSEFSEIRDLAHSYPQHTGHFWASTNTQ